LGTTPLTTPRCSGCEGTGKALVAASARARRAGTPLTPDERKAHEAMRTKAVDFLLSGVSRGQLVLREFRRTRDDKAGALDVPTTMGNAFCLWVLVVAGLSPDDGRLARAWKPLREDAQTMIDKKGVKVGVQTAALTLRALLAAKDPLHAPLVEGLVDLLTEGQRSSGLWGDEIVGDDKGEEFTSLFAVESLLLASRAGVKVKPAVWSRALQAATKATGNVAKSGRRSAWVTGTDVASSTAMVIMAKAGQVGAASREEYLAMPAVQKGLAWIERYGSLEDEPVVTEGVLLANRSDRGYFAWLYALQRLGQLLSLDRIGGLPWHAAGSRRLLQLQLADGAFEELGPQRLNGPVRSTGSALLFLVRATPSVTKEEAPR
jgi:hypothetical protein